MRLLKTQFSDKELLDKMGMGMRMGIKESLRRIWLISANKIKPSESICNQSSQTQTAVIIATNNCHTILYHLSLIIGFGKTI